MGMGIQKQLSRTLSFVVLKEKERIVGTQGMVPIYLNVRGTVCLSGKSENSLLGMKFRGSDNFQKMYAFAISQCQLKKMTCTGDSHLLFVFGETNLPSKFMKTQSTMPY